MDVFVRNVNLRTIDSHVKPKLPTGGARSSSVTHRGARGLCVFLVLALASCARNPAARQGALLEGDTVTHVQELRDSISRSLLKSRDVAPRGKTSSSAPLQEKGSMSMDTLVGSVYVSGNEPFTRLTLALEDGKSSIFLDADTTQSKQLRKLQGRVVRIVGAIVRSEAGDRIRVNEFVIVQ